MKINTKAGDLAKDVSWAVTGSLIFLGIICHLMVLCPNNGLEKLFSVFHKDSEKSLYQPDSKYYAT